MDAYLTQFANAARQRNAARAQPVLAAGATEEPALVGLPPVIVRPSDHGAERAPPGYVLVAASALAGATAMEGSAALVAATGALGPIAAAVAAGAAVYLAYKQYRSLVDQGVLPPVTMGQDNIEGYDPLGHPILKVLPPGYGEGPRVLAPLSGLTPAAPVPGTRTGEGGFTPAPKLDKPGQDGFTPAPLRPQIMNSWGDGAPTTVDQGHQDKHIQGTNNYDPTRSRSALTANPQQLLDTYSGKGQPVKDVPRGQQGFREVFDTQGMVIGSFHDLGTGADLPTTRGTIHYSKDGAHIVPARPNFSGKNQHD